MAVLIQCTFDGRAFSPASPFQLRLARERFGEGEIVLLNVENERSMRSHRHYFATLHDLWSNLPERFATETWAQSSEHLRKFLLIRAGYSETTTYACESKAEAQRLAAAIRPLDEFGIVVARGLTVMRFSAKSQSVKAMGSKVFAASKTAVLELAETVVAGGELPAVAA
jgi:hypothetical protein